MKHKGWIILLAAVLMLSACSSSNPPATAASSRSGETLPNRPSGETRTSGEPLSTRAAEPQTEAPQPQTEVPDTSPVQTEPEGSTEEPESVQTQPAAPESTEAPTAAPSETTAEPETEPFVMPDFFTGKTYSVNKYWYGEEEDNVFVMDEEGHLLDPDRIPGRIEDILTGEVGFYVRTEYIKTGPDYEDVKVSTTLYDKDGNVLEEDVPWLFSQACGNCVVRLESRAALMWEGMFEEYSGELYDPYAHQVMQKDVHSLVRMTDSTALAVGWHGVLMGVVDAEGHALSGFPMETGPYEWPYVYGDGFVFVDCDDGEGGLARVILNSSLEYVDYAQEGENYRVFDCGSRGTILAKVLMDGSTYVFDLNKWEVLLTLDYSAEEMDEQRIICEYNDEKWLYDWDGRQLAGPYEELRPVREAEGAPFEGLIAVNETTVFRLDLDGNVLKQEEIPNLSFVSVYDGIVYCGTTEYDSVTDYYGYGMVVFDYELNKMIPDGYTNISLTAPGIYACPTTTPHGESRINLFNASGEMIFSNAVSVGHGDEHAIPVVKGFYVGLIDHQGNWIAKNYRYEQEPGD